ncbi:MAG: transglycosylase SLT domain-containing protein [Balneolaceae bacterium]
MNTQSYKNSIGESIVILILAGTFALSGCSRGDVDTALKPVENSLSVTVLDPVERDYAEIKNSGVLRMITQYSSNTYYLHQGIEVGFEYELVKEFTREHDLALEVVIIGADQNPFDLLNSGEGDIIAANYTITDERRQYASFTRPYNLVDQVVVYSSYLDRKPQTLSQLSGSDIRISVRRNSSYYERLMDLISEGYDLKLNIISDEMDTESTLFQVANGSLEATVSDDNMFDAAARYMDGLIAGPKIAESDTIAWVIRKNAPDLEAQLNRFLYKHFRFSEDRNRPRRSTFLNVLRKKYFEEGPHLAEYYNPDWQYQNVGVISPYDDLIMEVADSIGLDWLMLTAMAAQESKFNPNSKSWAGAVGLMQIMPEFSDIEYQKLYIPEINVREGARIIKEHLEHYSYMDSLNQWAFALATYNSGMGHIADARRLAIDHNKNPNEWEHVEEALLKLMQRRYYQNARYGFARGIETVQYVKEILNRYKTYETILTLSERKSEYQAAGIIGIKTIKIP